MSKADEANMGTPPQNQETSTSYASSEMPQPMPVLPEYIEQNMPPPSYEEIMGHQTQTSVQQDHSSDLPPLAYVDIMPRMLVPGNIKNRIAPKFDKFSFVIEVANRYLTDNPGLAVWKCETVERKVEAGPKIEMDKMIMHHSIYGYNVFIRGVRMWLVKKLPGNPPQQLGLMNVVPEKKVVEYASFHGHYMFADPFYTRFHSRTFVTFDGLKDTLVKLNSRLSSNPIPGTILNVECAMMKTFEMFSNDCDVDPDNTVYTSEHKFKRMTQILRIFYVKGPPSGEQIGMEEFHPSMTKPPAIVSPALWENWPMVMGKVGAWLANTRGVRVVNLQAFNARLQSKFGQAEIISDCTDEVQTTFMTREFVKIMRVFYTTGSSIQSPPNQNFSSRLFLPVRIGPRSFEGMAQTMFRIEAWLRLTGLPIYNVETVQYNFRDYQVTGVDTNRCTVSENPNLGNYYVTAIRVYFPCSFQEPDPNRLPPQVYYDPNAFSGSECCTVS